jgi:ArsR family transcriptional regulator, arsenate/arsenite/antimonite-responsive transcriptional repressor
MTIKRREPSVNFFHALSDDTRLEIMERLKDGEQCVCDLTDALKTGQSRLSFHLKVLKDAGLITDRPEGRWTFYSLNAEVLEELVEMVQSLQGSRSRVGSSSRCR